MYAMKIVPPVGTRRGQKARLSLVVAGGFRGNILESVQGFRIFCLENPFLSRFFGSVTVTLFSYG